MKLEPLYDGLLFKLYAIADERGTCFLREFVSQFPIQDEARLLAFLQRVADHGPPRNVEMCRRIEGAGAPLWEFKRGDMRVLWFYGSERSSIVITHGFRKKQAKTPRTEIERAVRLYRALTR